MRGRLGECGGNDINAGYNGREGRGLTPEVRILLFLSRFEPDEDVVREAATLAGGAEEVDWKRFLRLVAVHQVYPLVAENLRRFQQAGNTVPREVRVALTGMRLANSLRALALKEEALRVLTFLEDAGVRAFPYKGPLLAERLYGNAALRHADDIDVLVPKEEWTAAKEVLQLYGYRPVEKVGVNRRRYAISFVRVEGTKSFHLELHYDVELPYFGYRLEPLLSTVFEGSREAEFLLLCLHAVRHRELLLKWLCDLDAYLRFSCLDGGELLALAQRCRAVGALRCALEAVACTYNSDVNRYLGEFRVTGRRMPRLWRVPGLSWPSLAALWWAKFRMVDGGALRQAGLLLRRLAEPAPREDRATWLPPLLAWAYPLCRVVREWRRATASEAKLHEVDERAAVR